MLHLVSPHQQHADEGDVVVRELDRSRLPSIRPSSRLPNAGHSGWHGRFPPRCDVDNENGANYNDDGFASAADIHLDAGEARKVTSQELEDGHGPAVDSHGIGDGAGKWQLLMSSFITADRYGRRIYPGEQVPMVVVSLLENPTGHMTNLSRQDLCTRGMTIWGCVGQ